MIANALQDASVRTPATKMGLNVIMMGAPGAGKGTQAGRFARERGLPKISTGDMLREAIKAGHPVALEAKARMDRGELVDDDTIIAIVKDRLEQPDAGRGFVLDGFPRTVAQARALDEIMSQRNNGPLIVVDVMVPTRLTSEQRELLERFEMVSGEETYNGSGGSFFDRLRGVFR